MAVVLVATQDGCRAYSESGCSIELGGREISALASNADESCLAVIDRQEIWRRDSRGHWSLIAQAGIPLQSIVSSPDVIFAGGMNEASVLRVTATGVSERLDSFDNVPGRSGWFAGGPPLGVRSLAATVDGAALLAAVHVGGIPRSADAGGSWTPTIPVLWDVHEVSAHPSRANLVVAAAAIGLCVSRDAGQRWDVLSDGLAGTSLLAVALLDEEALFSVQDGPFAKRSQVWRWRIGTEQIGPVRDGLPEWLDGRVDTAHIASGAGRAALVDDGGSLWVSAAESTRWNRLATGLPYVFGLAIRAD